MIYRRKERGAWNAKFHLTLHEWADVRTDGRTIASQPKFLGCTEKQIFLPMVLCCARFARKRAPLLKYRQVRSDKPLSGAGSTSCRPGSVQYWRVENHKTANWSLRQGDEEVNKRTKQKIYIFLNLPNILVGKPTFFRGWRTFFSPWRRFVLGKFVTNIYLFAVLWFSELTSFCWGRYGAVHWFVLAVFQKGKDSPVFVPLGLLGVRDASWERGANTRIMRIRSVAGFTCNANTLKFVSKEGEVSSPFTTREWVFLVREMLAVWSNHVYRDFLGCSYWSSIDWAGFLAYFPKGLMFQSHNTLLRKA